jgi:predicted dehydrogenase
VTAVALGWGIVGTGQMAATMAHVLGARADARLVAVASRDQARAESFAAAHGIAHGCAGIGALLALPEVEVCYIATPPAQHQQDCVVALRAGRHVLCEKPLALNADQARSIAQVAEASGRFCMEALWTQFLPAIGHAERLLAAGAIGTPQHMAASFGLPTDAADPVFAAGHGALLDRGCYPISLALRLLGTPIDVQGCVTRAPSGADTAASLLLRFAGGATAALACSLTAYLANDIVISGPGGRLTLQEPITQPALLTLATAHAGPAGPPSLQQRLARRLPLLGTLARLRHTRTLRFAGNGYGHQIDEVRRCIAAGETQSAVMPLARSIAVLEIIDRLVAATGSGGQT